MRVKTSQLIEGCIVSSDIKCLTNRSIITKKTVLDEKLIEVLNAFLIEEINIEPTLVNGEEFAPNENEEKDDDKAINSQSFIGNYLRAVQEYKKMFKAWQAGTPMDITLVRNIILPLLERSFERTYELFTLHHYCTKEDYLYHHALTVGLLSGFIGKKLQLDKGEYNQLAVAGTISDCGMAKVDRLILEKKTALTQEEYQKVKNHPTIGYKMIQNIPILKDAVKFGVLQHHERIDGSGYPMGVTTEKLHFYGKVIAVADVYHAMTSERPYRSKQSPYKVLELMLQDNFGKFDIKVIKALTTGIANFSIGTKVKLSDGSEGEIVFVEENNPTRPMVRLTKSGDITQLDRRTDLYIEEIL